MPPVFNFALLRLRSLLSFALAFKPPPALEESAGAKPCSFAPFPSFPPDILRIALSEYKLGAHSLHGPAHWARTRLNAREICKASPQASPRAAMLFALLHDCRRNDDGPDPGHGERAARLAAQIGPARLGLTQSEFDSLSYALRRHTEGRSAPDATVAACWDADRLDLLRAGIYPLPEKLFSPCSKDPAFIAKACQRTQKSLRPRERGAL